MKATTIQDFDFFCPVKIWNGYLHELNNPEIPVENIRFNHPAGPTVPELVQTGMYVEIQPNYNNYNNYVRRVVSVSGPFSKDGDFNYPSHYTIVIDTHVNGEKTISRGWWNEIVAVNGKLMPLFADDPTTYRIIKNPTQAMINMYNHDSKAKISKENWT